MRAYHYTAPKYLRGIFEKGLLTHWMHELTPTLLSHWCWGTWVWTKPLVDLDLKMVRMAIQQTHKTDEVCELALEYTDDDRIDVLSPPVAYAVEVLKGHWEFDFRWAVQSGSFMARWKPDSYAFILGDDIMPNYLWLTRRFEKEEANLSFLSPDLGNVQWRYEEE